MKILHIVDYYMPGMGYQENLLPKWNAKQNNQVTIITCDRYQPVNDYSNSWGKILGERICGEGKSIEDEVEIIRLLILFEIKGKPWLKNLKSEIEKINPEVILIHGTTSFSFYRVPFIANKNKVPCMADNHMVFHVINKSLINQILIKVHRLLIKYIYSKMVYKFIGVTNETCDYLIKYEKVLREKVTFLSLGVDDSIFYKKKGSNTSLENNSVLILQTGKLTEDKKPQWLAEACINLLLNGLNIKCMFVGGGSNIIKDYINQLFIKNGFKNKVEFIDFVQASELPNYYSKADICVYPDGTSLSAFEAAACGTAVVMADYDASIDKVKNGLGLVYETGNINDLSSKLSKLVNDIEYRNKIIRSSIKSVKQNYTYKEISKKFLILCNQAVKQLN